MPTRLTVLGMVVPERLLRRSRVLTFSAVCIAVLAVIEWTSHPDVSLGVLYVFPVAIAATALTHSQVVLMAVLCAAVRDQFHPPLDPLESVLRFAMATVAYGGAGLLVLEVFQNRQRMLKHYVQLRLETGLRRKAEQQLRIMADDSPAGMITIDVNARVLGANQAAHEMFGFNNGRSMISADASRLVPAFASALRVSETNHLRTSASGWANKADGSHFPVMTWFSTYGSGSERCLAAVIVDTSEEVRDRERENLEHRRAYNQLLAGAVSHEICNMCSAISVVSSNLKRLNELKDNEDFRALQTLVQGLSEVAKFELRRQRQRDDRASIAQVIDQLRVVIEPDWADVDGEIEWSIADDLPAEVRAAPHALLQSFLNLAQNSLRAVEEVEERSLQVRVSRSGSRVAVSFIDSGLGVKHPGDLFHPFRPNADGLGLGLYISRALLQTFGGELVHVPTPSGCRFDVTLASIVDQEDATASIDEPDHSNSLIHSG